MSLVSINPATGEKIREYQETSQEETKVMLQQAQDDFLRWRETTFEHRRDLLLKVAVDLRLNAQSYAEIMTAEMGKPIKE